jgi:8-oxo-dGTP pyrophosphatase MutT (NUDIX family)
MDNGTLVANLACMKNGKVLLVWKQRGDKNALIFPGGKLKPGESFKDCLRRELGEELPGSLFCEKSLREIPELFHGKTPFSQKSVRVKAYLGDLETAIHFGGEISGWAWIGWADVLEDRTFAPVSALTRSIVNFLVGQRYFH